MRDRALCSKGRKRKKEKEENKKSRKHLTFRGQGPLGGAFHAETLQGVRCSVFELYMVSTSRGGRLTG